MLREVYFIIIISIGKKAVIQKSSFTIALLRTPPRAPEGLCCLLHKNTFFTWFAYSTFQCFVGYKKLKVPHSPPPKPPLPPHKAAEVEGSNY